jgi:hypothetical protein
VTRTSPRTKSIEGIADSRVDAGGTQAVNAIAAAPAAHPHIHRCAGLVIAAP